jgi:hypothetical protein
MVVVEPNSPEAGTSLADTRYALEDRHLSPDGTIADAQDRPLCTCPAQTRFDAWYALRAFPVIFWLHAVTERRGNDSYMSVKSIDAHRTESPMFVQFENATGAKLLMLQIVRGTTLSLTVGVAEGLIRLIC